MLGTYRRVLALPGAWQFSLTGLVARLPWSIIALGIVLYISTATGSYALAGVLSACFQVTAAFGAVVTSRWVDRVGQPRLLPWLAAAHALLLVAFVATVQLGLPVLVQAVTVALAGAAQPAIGSMVRARWAYVAPDGTALRSAFAIESIVDEVLFTLGPLITAVLAFQVALPLPLLVAATLALAGGVALAAQRRTAPPPRHRDPDTRRDGALRQPGLLVLVVGCLGIGGVFGSYEVTVVAFCEEQGVPGASGLVLALWAFGSMLAGIVFGALHWRVPLPRQVMILAGLLTLVLVPAPFATGIVVLSVMTFVGGAAVAPALIATFSLTERLVPARLLTEGLTWTNSGLALGFSAGSIAAGFVIDAHGTTVAFVLPIASAAFALVMAALGQPVLRRSARPTAVSSSADGRARDLAAPADGRARDLAAPAVALNVEPVPGPMPGGVVDDPDGSNG